jgi:hypothetical protein
MLRGGMGLEGFNPPLIKGVKILPGLGREIERG